jgi:hypothetical protein
MSRMKSRGMPRSKQLARSGGKVEARAIKRKRIPSLTRHFQNQPIVAVTAIFIADMHVDGVGAHLKRGG